MPEGPDYLDLAMEALSAAAVATNPELGKNFCQPLPPTLPWRAFISDRSSITTPWLTMRDEA